MYVDQALREVTRRLLGGHRFKELEERLDPSNQAQVVAWAGTTGYLEATLKGWTTSDPGRKAAMEAAAAAMSKVVREVGRLVEPQNLKR